ncbi:MAG: S41 family peptidase [Anaerolineae bacterium]|nr:S41 family peptidase [Anaerolineae bacterium]
MQRIKQSLSLAVLVALVFAAGVFVGRQPQSQPAAAQTEEDAVIFQPFWEAYALLQERYVDPLDQEALMIGALSGMVESIGDPHMEYMTPEVYSRWNENLSNQFQGIGATVDQDENTGELIIVRPLDNSPALGAGLRRDDRVRTVNGEDITGLTLTEIVNLVRGPAGTPVTLGVVRTNDAGEETVEEITIIRDIITLPALDYRMLDNNIGYIQLYDFSFEANNALTDALLELDANNLDGLVLDLRGNGGGFLDVALNVLSMFVEDGPILIEEFPNDQELVENARGGAVAPDVPLVVLVDQASASASELVAGTLRDRERAVVVGMPTFGKNVVQSVQELSNGGAVRISIARWLTPERISVQPDGLMPDVMVEYDETSDPEFDNQLEAAVRALKGLSRGQAQAPIRVPFMRF